MTGARGNTTSLVGTPQQVAEALVDYYDLGVTTFLIRGFDPLDDAIDYGRELLPLTRRLIGERRGAAQARLSGGGVGISWRLGAKGLCLIGAALTLGASRLDLGPLFAAQARKRER